MAISITDPREVSLPDVGMIDLEDAETGETILIDTGSRSIRNEFYNKSMHVNEERSTFFTSIGGR